VRLKESNLDEDRQRGFRSSVLSCLVSSSGDFRTQLVCLACGEVEVGSRTKRDANRGRSGRAVLSGEDWLCVYLVDCNKHDLPFGWGWFCVRFGESNPGEDRQRVQCYFHSLPVPQNKHSSFVDQMTLLPLSVTCWHSPPSMICLTLIISPSFGWSFCVRFAESNRDGDRQRGC
jgi:hypothetical protein